MLKTTADEAVGNGAGHLLHGKEQPVYVDAGLYRCGQARCPALEGMEQGIARRRTV